MKIVERIYSIVRAGGRSAYHAQNRRGATTSQSKVIRLLLLACSFIAMAANTPALAQLGSSSVLAKVPDVPGFPEGVAVRNNRVYVTGPANFGIFTPSAVWEFNQTTGALMNTFAVTLQPAPAMKGLSAGNFGPDGAFYVPEPFMGVIIRMELNQSNTQSVYAGPFPAPGGFGSSLLNELAFDDAGFLYVTDTFLGTIYRVPPGGGAPAVWFSDARLLGDPALPFGVNGIRLDKNDQYVYISVTAQIGNLDGVIYRLPRVATPMPGDLEQFHRYPLGGTFPGAPDGPDGIAFSQSGKLYVALAGTSQISVLLPNGAEQSRYAGPAANPGGDPNPMPWANPANMAFDDHDRSLLFTNHASLIMPPDARLFSVIKVFVNDTGLALP